MTPRPKITKDDQTWLVWIHRFGKFWKGLAWFKSKWSIVATTITAIALIGGGLDTMTGSHARRWVNKPMHEKQDSTLAVELRQFRVELLSKVDRIDVKVDGVDHKLTKVVSVQDKMEHALLGIPGVEERESKFRHQQWQERRRLHELFGDTAGVGAVGASGARHEEWVSRRTQ